MGLTITYTKVPDRLITMGQAAKVIEAAPLAKAAAMPIPVKDQKKCELCSAEFHADRIDSLCVDCRAGMDLAKVIPPPVVEPENKRGRKKVANDKKLSDETGVKTIKKEDAGTQGAIGSGGVNAPAQEKVPDKPADSDKGDK